MKRTAGIPYLCAVLLFTAVGVQSASAGVLNGTSGARMIRTVYFDIIYPPQSVAAASVLASCADELYVKACAELGSLPYFRMPVVITASNDVLNAYFTPLPYNRIVVYDVLPFADDSASLAVFSRSLESVFYHELVHAVSLNIKSPAFRVLSDIFADCINPALLTVPPLFSEGAAVAFESSQGEGRLNDAFSMHIVYQAKLEGAFPSWREAAGSRDIYPSGAVPYLFGGAFTRWLIEAYGQDAYAEFWYQCGRLQLFKLTAGIFKKVYGITLTDAWTLFEAHIELPIAAAEADALDGIEYSLLNRKNSLYRCLVSSAAGAAWIDPYTSSVRFAAAGSESAVTLITMSGLTGIAFSADGAYLALSRTVSGTFTANEVFVYHMQSGALKRVPQNHVRSGTVLCLSGGGYAVAAVQTGGSVPGQSAAVVVHQITEDAAGNWAVSRQELLRYTFEPGIALSSFCAAAGGRLAFTIGGSPLVSGRQESFSAQSVCLLNPADGTVTEYAVPDASGYKNFRIRSIAPVYGQPSGSVRFVFSWAAAGTFPRAGFLTVEDSADSGRAVFSLMEADVSGGVYAPVPAQPVSDGQPAGAQSGAGRVLYSAHLFDHDRLMVLDSDAVAFRQFSATVRSILCTASASVPVPAEADSEPYSMFRYMTSGVFLPAALIPQYDILRETDGALLPGATWITADPAETVIITASGGINPFTLESGLYVSARTTGNSVSVNAESAVAFSQNGFEQAVTSAELAASVPAGRASRFLLSGTLSWFAGYAGRIPVFQHVAENVCKAEYSSVRSGDRGYYNVRGFAAAVFTDTLYAGASDTWYGNVGINAGLCLPGFIPVRAGFSLFPDMETFTEFKGEAVLASFEIQKAIPFVPLYINRFALIAGYEGTFERTNDSWDIIRLPSICRNWGGIPYYDTVYLTAELISSVNTGLLTGSRFSVSATCSYLIRDAADAGTVSFGFTGALLY